MLRDAREQRGLFTEAIEASILLGQVRLNVAADTAAAVREVDAAVARHPLSTIDARERPYVRLARFYVGAGRADRAATLIAEYDSIVPRDYRASDAWLLIRTRALLRMARGEIAEGVAELRGPERGSTSVATIVELARGYERLNQPDSALAAYERYFAARSLVRVEDDGLYLPQALARVGELREARGDTVAALDAYERLLRLWDEAEPTVRRRRASIEQHAAALRPRTRLR